MKTLSYNLFGDIDNLLSESVCGLLSSSLCIYTDDRLRVRATQVDPLLACLALVNKKQRSTFIGIALSFLKLFVKKLLEEAFFFCSVALTESCRKIGKKLFLFGI